MRKFVVITGGLGNQLFQIAGALSATDQVVNVVTCIGSPKLHAGELEVASLDFQQRVEFTKCKKRHYLSPLTFRAMLSLATTKRHISDNRIYSTAIRLFASAIFSAHLRSWVYPRISMGVGHDSKFTDVTGNLFIGYFQSHLIHPSVKQLLINALDKIKFNQSRPKVKSSEVFIHIRLGDYKSENTIGVLSSTYFSSALQLLENYGPISDISIFSDEPVEALKVISPSYYDRIKFEEVAEESPLITLCRMRGYASYVLVNSTFSWWAAYTSAPKNVFVPYPWFATGDSPVELIPESWVQVKRDWKSIK
jgi:hypothetical protein